MRRRTRTVLAATLAAAAVALLGGVLADGPGGPGAGPGRAEAALSLGRPGSVPAATPVAIARLEARVATQPKDAAALASLGLAYEQRARETADPALYIQAEAAFGRALDVDPRSYPAATGLASVAASRHQFSRALRLARRAVTLRPKSAAAYGILGDALVELGRYREGFAAFDRMAALEPNLSSYTRIAYGRELVGRPGAALEALRLAADAGSGSPENVAWTLVQAGNLLFDTGRIAGAETAYRAALARYPGFAYALAGRARVDAARGRYSAAAAQYQRVTRLLPLPQHAIALAETLRGAGRPAEARRADALVSGLERLFAASGVRTELETALYDADRGRNLAGALARAREAHASAPSIHAEDVLAWTLYRNGRCVEARTHSVRALRLGTRDALKLFHRGMIERCLGHGAAARTYLGRALAVNPHFSLRWAPVAREALS
jgi:tetratricopeptide (TPR) repeat protein